MTNLTHTKPEPQMPNLESHTVIVSAHVLIRDAHTKQILVNKRGN